MKLTISGLKLTKRRKRFKMKSKASMDNSFKNFRNKVKIGYRTIARSLGNECFLWRGVTMACLKLSGKVPSESKILIKQVIS